MFSTRERSGCGDRMEDTGPLASQSESAIQLDTGPENNKNIYYKVQATSG